MTHNQFMVVSIVTITNIKWTITKIREETFVLDMTLASGSEALRLTLLVVVSTFSIAEFW